MTDDNRYITLRYSVDLPTDLLIQVKFDDNGVVVDLYSEDEDGDVEELESTWRLYDELPIERKEEDYPCKGKPLYWSKTYGGHCEREQWECKHCLKMEKDREGLDDD